MALALSHAHHALASMHRSHGRARAALEKMHGVTRSVVRTAEVGGAAFGFGLLQGRLPEKRQKVMGVDIGLGSAALLHVMAFAGIGGDYSGHLHAIGDGALAAFLTKQGILYGAKLAKEKGLADEARFRVLGENGVEGAGLTDEELAEIQARR